MMRVLIAGVDGYIGWPLALRLSTLGHEVAGIDNYSRREWVREIGSISGIPILRMSLRQSLLFKSTNNPLRLYEGNLCDYPFVKNTLSSFQPEAIVHLGEMPSAPYSMIDADHALFTQTNNIMGTLCILHAIKDFCPECHLIKLGTMGEYGTPNCRIPEGKFPKDSFWRIQGKDQGSLAGMLFPRSAGSWYHQSKVHDTHNIDMACKIWGLCSTDIMQGVVYGITTNEMVGIRGINTRFDFDSCFGTALNRFCAQAIVGEPITPYGSGNQKRGFLPLGDSIKCLTIAIEQPPLPGEYRTFNQFERVYTINELAKKVRDIGQQIGLNPSISPVANPRIEAEDHYYMPDRLELPRLGYEPTGEINTIINNMLESLLPHQQRIEKYKHLLNPNVRWDNRSVVWGKSS